MLESFTPATFADRLRETFRVHAPAPAPVDVQLVEVTSAPGAGARRAPFAIVLRGPHAPVLPQRTYRVSHDGLGAFDLFLVPVGPDAEGMRYEAVFG